MRRCGCVQRTAASARASCDECEEWMRGPSGMHRMDQQCTMSHRRVALLNSHERRRRLMRRHAVRGRGTSCGRAASASAVCSECGCIPDCRRRRGDAGIERIGLCAAADGEQLSAVTVRAIRRAAPREEKAITALSIATVHTVSAGIDLGTLRWPRSARLQTKIVC